MLDTVTNLVLTHATLAPWIIFTLLLLAGLNVPISIDIILVVTAFLAGTLLPEKAFFLFLIFTMGCIMSAWLSYWLGRIVGRKLLTVTPFSKLISTKRVDQMEGFYKKYGAWTLVCSRFIPFGVRNCVFLTTGISKMPFARFIAVDAFACTLWSAIFFTLFYRLSMNIDGLYHQLKVINIFIFCAFSVTLISIFWYKKRNTKKSRIRDEDDPENFE
ncbi:MAG: hypothetical protein S4CHLAM102_05050 [Chlamydiia bacterium]|nr:hypothetical protein [Chlamydiia bacterium]